MRGQVMRFLLTAGTFFVGGLALADEPAPAPKPVPAQVVWPAPYYRRSAYEVWQYYGVDRYGRFRPRVVYSPYGAYFLYNGAPYPWATTRSLEWMPYVVD